MVTAGAYVDTHCHLDQIFSKYKHKGEPFDSFKAKANITDQCQGYVSNFCDLIAIQPAVWKPILDASANIFGAFGIHPHCSESYTDEVETQLIECMQHPKAVAWGEMGLDYFKNFAPKDAQIACFMHQLEMAMALGKPLVIHSRDAEADTLAIFRQLVPKETKMHIHCYTGSADFATTVISEYTNAYFGLTGVITKYGRTDLQAVVRDAIPLDRILLETDGPYLRPVGAPGRCTHPGHIPLIASKISELKAVPLETVYSQCRVNTIRMYGI